MLGGNGERLFAWLVGGACCFVKAFADSPLVDGVLMIVHCGERGGCVYCTTKYNWARGVETGR